MIGFRASWGHITIYPLILSPCIIISTSLELSWVWTTSLLYMETCTPPSVMKMRSSSLQAACHLKGQITIVMILSIITVKVIMVKEINMINNDSNGESG